MNYKIKNAISVIQALWPNITSTSIQPIALEVGAMSRDPDIQKYLKDVTRVAPHAIELHRNPQYGFVLLAYAETKGTYRAPHNHGDAWVVYAVVSGDIEMKSYSHSPAEDGADRLHMQSRELLSPGDVRVYLKGEIHDTRSLSGSAVVLRLTSTDLREEEKAGRMKRFAGEEA